MSKVLLSFMLLSLSSCMASNQDQSRQEAEYYLAVYARHYDVPIEFVRAIVDQESGWQRCPVSPTGAVGLMQLMPETARRLNVQNRCDMNHNISGGVRYLAWLMSQFDGDLRLVAAAYYVGERPIQRRALNYSNRDVVSYVVNVHRRFDREKRRDSWPKWRTR